MTQVISPNLGYFEPLPSDTMNEIFSCLDHKAFFSLFEASKAFREKILNPGQLRAVGKSHRSFLKFFREKLVSPLCTSVYTVIKNSLNGTIGQDSKEIGNGYLRTLSKGLDGAGTFKDGQPFSSKQLETLNKKTKIIGLKALIEKAMKPNFWQFTNLSIPELLKLINFHEKSTSDLEISSILKKADNGLTIFKRDLECGISKEAQLKHFEISLLNGDMGAMKEILLGMGVISAAIGVFLGFLVL